MHVKASWFALFSILLFYSTVFFFHFTEQINDDDDDDDDDEMFCEYDVDSVRAILVLIKPVGRSITNAVPSAGIESKEGQSAVPISYLSVQALTSSKRCHVTSSSRFRHQ